MLQKFHCENVLKELNDFGQYQKFLLFGFIMPLAILAAFQSSYIYNEFVPDHWCRVDLLVNFSYGEQNRLIRPRLKYNDDDNNGQETLKLISNCEMYDINYRQVLTGLEIPKQNSSSSSSTLSSSSSSSVFIPIKKCSPISGWVYNRNQFRENAAMHYNFVCDRRQHIQMIGFVRKLSSALFSLIYAILSDRYGRKIGLIFILTAYILSAISPVLTTNYYAFLTCQAIQGSTWPIGILIGTAFGIEFVTPEYRADVLALVGLAFQFGEWCTYFLIQALRHWVWIAIVNTGFVIPYFIFYQYYDESPQWLLATKRFDKLKDLFERMNRINRAKLDNDSIDSIISKFTHYYDHERRAEVSLAISMQNLDLSTSNHNNNYKQRIISSNNYNNHYRRPSMNSFLTDDESVPDGSQPSFWKKIKLFIKRSTLFQMIFLWAIVLITNELIIDFLSKRKNRFDDNLLVDRFFGSLIKMPIILLTWYLVNQCFGRRWSNCIILSLNLAILMFLLFGQYLLKKIIWLNVGISVLGIMLAECSEMITILQTLELTSTRYRIIVVSIVHLFSQSAFLAIIYWLYNYNLRIIFNVQTKLIFISCITLLSIILASFVTETRNEYLPIGVLESEQLITNFNYWSVSKDRSDIEPSNLFLSLSKWDVNANHQIVGSIKHMEKFTDS
ncbi:solute carrier family 22 member 2-like isoform X1 [Dermatophagoides pteronyssinus]|uniref:solute carrier family 22 member 2-like isoform X1 n=2 Tax=Dermatophagoides pteronyssinus TaxID=6956 RepID=UPI003F6793E9